MAAPIPLRSDLTGDDLRLYAASIMANLMGGGHHSYYEIAVVLKAAGTKADKASGLDQVDPDQYKISALLKGFLGLQELIDKWKAKVPVSRRLPGRAGRRGDRAARGREGPLGPRRQNIPPEQQGCASAEVAAVRWGRRFRLPAIQNVQPSCA